MLAHTPNSHRETVRFPVADAIHHANEELKILKTGQAVLLTCYTFWHENFHSVRRLSDCPLWQ
jgi:hypothetical protein